MATSSDIPTMDPSMPSPNASGSEWRDFCFTHPRNEVCLSSIRSFYEYRLDIAPNAAFLAIFSISLVAYLATYALTRRGLGFTVAMVLGLVCEILGYAGRVMSWRNQWDENGFLMQICCLTIGPAFMAAALYLCLRRIVYAFGKDNSLIAPEWYTRFFIPCDVISLILQALGGGMASVGSHNDDEATTDAGTNIMIAGLAFQVFTILLFIIASALFALRTIRRHRALGASALDQSAAAAAVRSSRLFKLFVAALGIATLCIFWRSVFRVAELSRGWDGPLMKRQGLFVGFEGVLVVVACVVLNLAHPSFCFRELMEGKGGIGGCCGRRRRRANAEVADVEREGKVRIEPPSGSVTE